MNQINIATAARNEGVAGSRHVLILVENLPVPFDRRVWQEALTLRQAGYEVSVICPTGRGYDAEYEVLEGVHIYRHRLREAQSARGYPAEYLSALSNQLRLSFKVRRRQRIDVIQACNPPDLMFLVALVHKRLFGTRFVFDHHDLSPELYLSKFGRKDVVHALLLWLERLTFRTADSCIATNEVFREIAMARGGVEPERAFIVKSYPDSARTRRREPEASLASLGKCVVGYVGIMGSQDGVETLIRAMREIVHERGRDDIYCALIGDGTELERLRRLATELGLDDAVRFTGYRTGADLMAHLSAVQIGVIPDPPNEFNDKLSMNKVFEYMMLGIPIVQFDLRQARKDAGEAGLVVAGHSPADLADGILALADDPTRRARMADAASAIAGLRFQWPVEAAQYLSAYEAVFNRIPAHA